jgi:hypothetical protein
MSTTQWLFALTGVVLVVGGVAGLVTSRPGSVAANADPAATRARRPGWWAALLIAASALLLALADVLPAGWTTALSVAELAASVAASALALTSAVRHYRLGGTRGTRSDGPS